MEKIKKGKKIPLQNQWKVGRKILQKKGKNYYNKEVNKIKASTDKDSKEKKRRDEEKSSKKKGKHLKWKFKRRWKVGEQWRGSDAKDVPIIKSTNSM